MVVEVATTSSNEKTNVDDVVVSTQFYDEVQQPFQTYNSPKRNKKKAWCFALIFVLILALSASTAYFGFRSHKYQELYEALSVRSSGNRYRLGLFKPQLELDAVTDYQWQMTADSIVQYCFSGVETDLEITNSDEQVLGEVEEQIGTINADCLKRQIRALTNRRN